MWIKFVELFHTYYNNIFALQYAHIHNSCFDFKHTYLCNSLKHHIHGYFIYMVHISYNQNMYFKIQCKKSKNKITIHFLIF